MTIKRLASSWIGRVAACLLLLLALPAKAVYYTGVWDPTYGAPFGNLGWRGTAEFFVPDFCKPGGTIDIGNVAQCDGLAAVQAATVQFYDTTDPDKTTLVTLGFDPVSLTIGTLRYVDGALTELTTSLSNFVVPDADLANYGVGANDFFSLQFTLSGPTLAWGSCNVDTGCDVRGFNDAANFPPTFVITEVSVPEPGTPLLAGLALLMMAAFGLRSRARRAG